VGTPDYIAPEIFQGQGYDLNCDWWSFGAIMFECLVGYAPFCSMDNNPRETYQKIMNWPTTLVFPDDVYLSPEAEGLIRGLMCWKEQRFSLEQIKTQKFFEGVEWSILRDIQAPWVPSLTSITDTSYFPVNELEAKNKPLQPMESNSQMDVAFLGYVDLLHLTHYGRLTLELHPAQIHIQEVWNELMVVLSRLPSTIDWILDGMYFFSPQRQLAPRILEPSKV
jgi:serine/threonine protein kinase